MCHFVLSLSLIPCTLYYATLRYVEKTFEEKTISFFPSNKFLIFTLDSPLSTLFVFVLFCLFVCFFLTWRTFCSQIKTSPFLIEIKIEICRRIRIPNKQVHAQSQEQKYQRKVRNKFKVNNKDTRMTSFTNFEHISLIFLVFLSLTLRMHFFLLGKTSFSIRIRVNNQQKNFYFRLHSCFM